MVFLGRGISEPKNYSEKIAEIIDEEVHGLLDRAYERAHQILGERRFTLDLIAKTLIAEETVEAEKFEALLAVKPEDAQAVPGAAEAVAVQEGQAAVEPRPEERRSDPSQVVPRLAPKATGP